MTAFASLDHLLDQLNSPTPQSALIAGLGLLLLLFRHYRIGSLILLLAGAWLYLCATPAFVGLMRDGLESPYPYVPAGTYPQADAIVVFGGDGMPDPRANWEQIPDRINGNRLGFAYQLYREGRAPIMVLSANKGGAIKMARILETKGLPKAALRVESQADSTYQNALYSSRILKQEKLGRVLLVTSPYHMPRALAVLREQGIDAIPAPTMPQVKPTIEGNAWLPHRSALSRSHIYLHEYLGLFAYGLRGLT
ncbi:YdcF family protein [Rhodanobacter ginsengiterrae]|uniref:YdcF family protein n=1 Tax=Rhodanobacter ginsengiterrae TaxID=2008451 RepID=UPI003CF207A2